jgi:glycosyltransferase involved in cell wall biosynthesis
MTELHADFELLFDRLETFVAEHADASLTVHVDIQGDTGGVATRLLSLPFVASILLMRRDQALAERFPRQVGWLDHGAGEHILPERCGDTLWRWNAPDPLGYVMGELEKRGVKFFAYATTLLRKTTTYTARRERIRALKYLIHVELRFKRRYGTIGAKIEGRLDEFAWNRRLRKFTRNRPQKSADARSGILLVTGTLGAGGSERQLVNTALALRARYSESISILCLSANASSDAFYKPLLAQKDVEIIEAANSGYVLGQDIDARLSALWADVGPSDGIVEAIIRSAVEIDRRKPRIVHAWLDFPNIAVGLAALLLHVPRIVLSTRSVSPTHFDFLQAYMRPGYRLLTRQPEVRILNNSDAGAVDYARWLGIPRRKITTLRNGVSKNEIALVSASVIETYRRKVGIPPGAPVVGSIFRFGEEKRPLLWAEIASQIARKRSDVCFLIIGDGPLRDRVRESAEQNGFSNRMFLPGRDPNPAVALQAMSCLLLTSRVEGLPNVILEAHAMGIPVVTSRSGGAPEATDHGNCGWVVDGSDPRDYARRIIQVIDDKIWRENAARLGPELIAHRFSLEQMISQTMSVYGLASPQFNV